MHVKPKTRLRKQGHSLIRKGGFKTVSKQNQKITYKLILQREFILFLVAFLVLFSITGTPGTMLKYFLKSTEKQNFGMPSKNTWGVKVVYNLRGHEGPNLIY